MEYCNKQKRFNFAATQKVSIGLWRVGVTWFASRSFTTVNVKDMNVVHRMLSVFQWYSSARNNEDTYESAMAK
jgi:hypothetical protein